MAREEIVSNASEQLILVDEHDREIGFRSKADCHTGKGVLHRAFSIFVFNSDNELLLQQRSPSKLLWPGYWSNTCCSHPRRGEAMDDGGHAPARAGARLRRARSSILYKFKYQAQFGARGRRARVVLGVLRPLRRSGGRERQRDRRLAVRRRRRARARAQQAAPETFTPWFKMEWVHIRANYLDGMLAGTGTDG